MSEASGYVSVVLAAVLYGIQYVPVKKHEIYDGTVFQWFMCSGILFTGTILGVLATGDIPKATLLDLVGGVCWAVSNTLLLPVVKLLGLGLGFALFQATNVLSGYTIGRLGLFGAAADPGRIPWLRDCGAICLCCSFFLMAFVKGPADKERGTDESPPDTPLKSTSLYVFTRQEDHGLLSAAGVNGLRRRPSSCSNLPELHSRLLAAEADLERVPNLLSTHAAEGQSPKAKHKSARCPDSPPPSSLAGQSPKAKHKSARPDSPPPSIRREESGLEQFGRAGRGIGVLLVLVAGFLNTLAALPFDWWLAKHPATPKSSFVFAQGLGAWMAGTLLYMGYASLRRFLQLSSPQHSCIRPAFLSGAIWACGFVFMCLGIDGLGFTAGFTYCSVLPVAVSTLISITVFGEIRGRQQLAIFLSCFCIQITGVLCIAAGSH